MCVYLKISLPRVVLAQLGFSWFIADPSSRAMQVYPELVTASKFVHYAMFARLCKGCSCKGEKNQEIFMKFMENYF